MVLRNVYVGISSAALPARKSGLRLVASDRNTFCQALVHSGADITPAPLIASPSALLSVTYLSFSPFRKPIIVTWSLVGVKSCATWRSIGLGLAWSIFSMALNASFLLAMRSTWCVYATVEAI